ncbi:MAG: TrkH family potassium uptake protein [bacterium]
MLTKFMKLIKKLFDINITPAHIITFSFIIVIGIGTSLLMLPISSNSNEVTNFLDALFTATSAVCVTGLTVLNTTQHWSIFGKIVILIMIQIGALGFMSIFTIVLIALGKRITLKDRILIQESFNLSNFKGIVRFLKTIIKWTIIIEGVGAIFLALIFIPEFGITKGILFGIFHSISAFCNAGFDIIGDSSLVAYRTNYFINIVIMILVILGGLGFSVWIDLSKYVKYKIFKIKDHKSYKFNLSVHSKLALVCTAILLISGWVITLLLEYNNPSTIGTLPLPEKILISAFQSVTLRTAGFDAIGQGDLTYGSKFFAVLLMAIGGSPGGTAGGMKTVTVGILIVAVISSIQGRNVITAFKKSISFSTIEKALSVVLLMISLIFIFSILLTITEKANLGVNYDFIDLLYEVVSALGTVGLSTGVTPMLSTLGKCIIIICMFLGRLGATTVVLGLTFSSGSKNKKNLIKYPEEKILVG